MEPVDLIILLSLVVAGGNDAVFCTSRRLSLSVALVVDVVVVAGDATGGERKPLRSGVVDVAVSIDHLCRSSRGFD